MRLCGLNSTFEDKSDKLPMNLSLSKNRRVSQPLSLVYISSPLSLFFSLIVIPPATHLFPSSRCPPFFLLVILTRHQALFLAGITTPNKNSQPSSVLVVFSSPSPSGSIRWVSSPSILILGHPLPPCPRDLSFSCALIRSSPPPYKNLH